MGQRPASPDDLAESWTRTRRAYPMMKPDTTPGNCDDRGTTAAAEPLFPTSKASTTANGRSSKLHRPAKPCHRTLERTTPSRPVPPAHLTDPRHPCHHATPTNTAKRNTES